jgi:diacylglycerol kinase family enzyme
MRKLLVLFNPVFSRHKDSHLPVVLQTFRRAGVAVELLETGENRAAGCKARRAVEQGVDSIVVCGGDGTVFDVLQGIAGSSVPLGIIPFGTGNVLAQNLKVPRQPEAAARWILAARPRSIPLGKLTHCTADGQRSWYFAMAAGMGVHAAMMAKAHSARKSTSGPAAYFAAGLELLLRHPLAPFDLEITTTDGALLQRRVYEAIAVRVSELNLWRPGGGFDLPFLRLATVDTGPRQSGSIRTGSRWQLARATFEGMLLSAGARNRRQREGAPARYEDVVRIVCRPIQDFDYEVPLAVEADGEVLDASCAVIEMAGKNVQMLSA